jgi:hypothetical protein
MRIGRLATVLGSIALVGAAIGGAVGAILFAAWEGVYIFVFDGPGAARGMLAVEGAKSGALLGAVLAPITAWFFLRRVPLGKALLHTTLGTAGGAAIGLVIDRLTLARDWPLPASLLLALAGFLGAAIRLRITTRTPAAGAGMQSAPPPA